MVDERSKRKPNFDERNSAPVVLADGQVWHVPKPWLKVRPVFRGGRAVSAYRVLTCGAELDGLVEAMAEAEDLDGQVIAIASLAAYCCGGTMSCRIRSSTGCWHFGRRMSGPWTGCGRSWPWLRGDPAQKSTALAATDAAAQGTSRRCCCSRMLRTLRFRGRH